MVQFIHQAPWVQLLNSCVTEELAATNHKPPFTSFQLATIDSETGYPNNRTLIFRGWLFDNKSSNVITFTTDKRMTKYQELLANDKVDAVFWFSNIRKQVRLRGQAKLLDQDHHPNVYIPENVQARGREAGDVEEGDYNSTPQKQQIHTTLISPNFAAKNSSDATLSPVDLVPPTSEEWTQELERHWNSLSKAMKTSFRKPMPKSPINEEDSKLIDKIQRGVDGKKDDDGLKNFAVVAVFVNHVDYFEQDKDKRYIYELEEDNHSWTEQEVCP
ncbi:uncharacterized protein LODBEIA_P61240 [Lodderomyces beijingensis]|uniref:Pyridoxamine 5'-phosphate oxidase Alr4036 family FMN-binding domain-containing protein n=1 Tax=Lodderomyces beijingensis TaxID=1775926 RepID=A0ABP0ZW62_9ASCO